ncbi:MAG: ferredoxin family protein [Syntrophales bacterium]|nr:ferredoxin family protein [Syntrophales bacterium]
MARKGEVVIDEGTCLGCGYCEMFCPKKCIEISQEKFNPLGYPLAVFSNPEECNACGSCVIMCPQFAIEAYAVVNKGKGKERS